MFCELKKVVKHSELIFRNDIFMSNINVQKIKILNLKTQTNLIKITFFFSHIIKPEYFSLRQFF